ncbi:MAG: sugar phosphate nucleotidyltransferase [Ignavibacteria bacterium]|nr:sugar phosphate nucleotidyltransferase [Ignavibacteria bacterium]
MNTPFCSAFILAAGLGTRLGTLTKQQPKALVEVNGEPLLKINLLKLKKFGFTKVVINVHHFAAEIIHYLKENNNFGLEIHISDESNQLLDTGGAILKALPLYNPDEYILIHNVDVISDFDLKAFANEFRKSTSAATLFVRERNSSRKLLFDKQSQLAGWHNEQTNETKWVHSQIDDYQAFAFSGIHIIQAKLFADLPVEKCSVINLYLQKAKNNRILAHINNDCLWFDLGKKEQLVEIENELKKQQK